MSRSGFGGLRVSTGCFVGGGGVAVSGATGGSTLPLACFDCFFSSSERTRARPPLLSFFSTRFAAALLLSRADMDLNFLGLSTLRFRSLDMRPFATTLNSLTTNRYAMHCHHEKSVPPLLPN